MANTYTFEQTRWRLRLYVMGRSPASERAVGTIRQLCDSRIGDGYQLEIIDIERRPERARQDNIMAVPMLMRLSPQPLRRILGDWAEPERIARGLELPFQSG